MDDIKLPILPEVIVNGVVSVRSSDLKVLVDAFNELAKTVIAQQSFLTALNTEVVSCREDITKIAKILEELYET